MSEQAQERILSGIDIPKILGGALAAVCAAVAGSFLGVAGTLIGAALASIVGSVGTEIYTRSLQRGAKKLQTLGVPAFVRAPAAMGTPEVAAATDEDLPSHTVPATTPKRQIRWGHVAALAAGVFILAMGAIWMSEKAFGEPLSAAVGVSNDTGTSLGNAVGKKSPDQQPVNGTSIAPSEGPDKDGGQTPGPTSTGDSTATTAPAETPTTASTPGAPADAPKQNTDAGTGDGTNLDSGTGGGSSADTSRGSFARPGEGSSADTDRGYSADTDAGSSQPAE